MSILSAENIGLSFGDFDLFQGISVTVPNDARIGLIGPNGIGKTSLLLILAGLSQPSTGRVHIARGKRIGYLRQEAVDAFADRTNTVHSEMLTVFAPLREQQARLHELEDCMANGEFDEPVMNEYGALQLEFEHAGGYEYELRIQQTLEGLGLSRDTWEMPLAHLSGGQKTRALLARLLLEKPDLLMLDEPTNHLDVDAVEWLERTLREWPGALMVVSHDRYFLDNTANTIWEISPEGVETYSGNYSGYLLQRQERWEYYERVYEEEKARLTKEVDFIQRNWVRASTHARALGLLRRISRDLAIVDAYGVLALRGGKWSEMGLSVERPLDVIEAVRKVNAISLKRARPPLLRPRLPDAHTSGTYVLRAGDVTVGYPGNELFHIGQLELRRGECAVLMGPNGSGKTTFLKTLLGQMEPLRGELHHGASLKIGYFAQAHDGLRGDGTVIEEILQRKGMQENQARAYLAPYLFRGEDVYKPLAALSGGERARLALAILALEGANLLLLDEPTNHLDMPAREALQAVLEDFTGTILLVSHDRYLIDRLATQVWEIRGGELRVFNGRYREYVLRGAAPSNGSGAPKARLLLTPKPMARDNSKATRQRTQALTQLEERIRDKEREVQRLNAELQKAGGRSFEHANRLGWQLAEAQSALEKLMGEWEKLVA